MLRKEHLSLIAKHSLRHGLRGGAGLVSIALTLLVGLFLAQCAVGPLERVDKSVDSAADRTPGIDQDQRTFAKQKANEQIVKIAVKGMEMAMDPSTDQLTYLTEEKPAMISVMLVLLFLATPLFACLGGFNQTAGDIGSKGLRFLLFRTERANIFWGRFFGTLGFTALVNLLLFVILAIYIAAKIKVHPTGDMMLWMAQGYLRMMIFTLPYVALCAWISSAMESAFGALAISLLVAFFLPLFLGVAGSFEDVVKNAQYITPWGWKYFLLEPLGGKFFGGLAAMFGFSAIFLYLGHRNFTRRDL
jgi:ABC-type transport system involved in multi-copper enzyme maturation permease subunit